MNNKPPNINIFSNILRSPLKLTGLVATILIFAGIATAAWTYTTPPLFDCVANGTCYFGNMKINETTLIAQFFQGDASNLTAVPAAQLTGTAPLAAIPATLTGKDADTVDGYDLNQNVSTGASPTFASVNSSYYNTSDGRELQNGGCDASYCIRYNLTDGTTVEAINKTDGSAIRGADFVTVLNSATANNPASILLGEGSFSATANFDLPDGIIFSGMGRKTVLSGSDNNVIHATGKNITIKDMYITCNGYARKGIYLYNGSNNVVDNVEVSSCNLIYSAINLWNETDSEVRNSIVRDSEEGINIAGVNSGAVNNKLYGNNSDSNPDNGITLGVTNIKSYDLYAYDNFVTGNYDGIYVWNTDRAKVHRNKLNFTLKGIILCCNTTNSSVMDNRIHNITSILNFGGIHVTDVNSMTGDLDNNEGNIIQNNDVSEAYQDGIKSLENRTIIKNNNLHHNLGNGIFVTEASNNTIEGNECYNNNGRNAATPSGIRLVNVTNSTVKNNNCWDNRDTKLQKYGITLSGVFDLNNRVEGNDVQWGGVTGNINIPSTSYQVQNYGATPYNWGSISVAPPSPFGVLDTYQNSTSSEAFCSYKSSTWQNATGNTEVC